MPKLSAVKLVVADLLEARGITASRLAADSKGRISQRSAYRLVSREKTALYPDEIAALCDILGVPPGDLFQQT